MGTGGVRREPFKITENDERSLWHPLRRLFWRLIAPLPDGLYVRLKYLSLKGRWPNLGNPVRFCEKMQVRKLCDRNPLYTTLVDKCAVKDFVADRIGARHVLPTYWSGTDLGQVDWSSIPLPAVVKPNHASGLGRFLYTQQDVADLLREDPGPQWLAVDHSRYNREWAYGGVPRRLLIEKMLVVEGGAPRDFRFSTFDGEVSHITVDIREGGRGFSCAYSPDWQRLSLHDPDYFPPYPGEVPRPPQLDRMLEIAGTLGRDLDFARIDLFATDSDVYFGEITLYPGGGYDRFDPPEWENVLGKRWRQRIGNEVHAT